jgi:hypothetical protein
LTARHDSTSPPQNGQKKSIDTLQPMRLDQGVSNPWMGVLTRLSHPQILERGSEMSVEQRIDDLIEAGWEVLDSDFDPVAFQRWRRRAFDCLTEMVGSDHVYTRQFASFVRQGGKTNLLAAEGILTAAQQKMTFDGMHRPVAHGGLESVSHLA